MIWERPIQNEDSAEPSDNSVYTRPLLQADTLLARNCLTTANEGTRLSDIPSLRPNLLSHWFVPGRHRDWVVQIRLFILMGS